MDPTGTWLFLSPLRRWLDRPRRLEGRLRPKLQSVIRVAFALCRF